MARMNTDFFAAKRQEGYSSICTLPVLCVTRMRDET